MRIDNVIIEESFRSGYTALDLHSPFALLILVPVVTMLDALREDLAVVEVMEEDAEDRIKQQQMEM